MEWPYIYIYVTVQKKVNVSDIYRIDIMNNISYVLYIISKDKTNINIEMRTISINDFLNDVIDIHFYKKWNILPVKKIRLFPKNIQ